MIRTVNETKKELRRQIASIRAQIPEERKGQCDRLIADAFLSLPCFSDAKTVLLYASLPSEIRTDIVALQALRLGKTVAFPRTDKATRRMTFFRVGSLDELIPGAYGIREPSADAEELVCFERAVCLVPGLSFDRDGYRLGHGGGYYDRFLSEAGGQVFPVGAVYDRFFSETPLPRGQYDLAVRLIITEKGVFPAHG